MMPRPGVPCKPLSGRSGANQIAESVLALSAFPLRVVVIDTASMAARCRGLGGEV